MIKKLQNNFTTPEQSKRLLELGVAEWTADCLIKNNAEKDKPTIRVKEPCTGYYFAHDEYIPCWSVGRLMEICKICGSYELAKEIYRRALFYKDTVDGIICEMAHEVNIGNINFSKLEE